MIQVRGSSFLSASTTSSLISILPIHSIEQTCEKKSLYFIKFDSSFANSFSRDTIYSSFTSNLLTVPIPKRGLNLRSMESTNSKVNVQDKDSATIVPGVIVGAGRVGQALFRLGGEKDIVVKRGEAVPEDSTGPIFVCTRNDALESVVSSTPPHRRKDLVFLQNGMIEPWIESKSLEDTTQVLVYFAVAKAGDDPLDGKTDVNPEGLTAVHGRWAQAVANRLHSYNLSCKVLDAVEFKKCMFEKLIWISSFMLVGAKYKGITVGEVESKYQSEVDILINELASVIELEKNLKFDDGLKERLSAYARSVAHFPTAIKEFEWRNGWFYSLSKRALESGKVDPCPTHTSWLKEVKAI